MQHLKLATLVFLFGFCAQVFADPAFKNKDEFYTKFPGSYLRAESTPPAGIKKLTALRVDPPVNVYGLMNVDVKELVSILNAIPKESNELYRSGLEISAPVNKEIYNKIALAERKRLEKEGLVAIDENRNITIGCQVRRTDQNGNFIDGNGRPIDINGNLLTDKGTSQAGVIAGSTVAGGSGARGSINCEPADKRQKIPVSAGELPTREEARAIVSNFNKDVNLFIGKRREELVAKKSKIEADITNLKKERSLKGGDNNVVDGINRKISKLEEDKEKLNKEDRDIMFSISNVPAKKNILSQALQHAYDDKGNKKPIDNAQTAMAYHVLVAAKQFHGAAQGNNIEQQMNAMNLLNAAFGDREKIEYGSKDYCFSISGAPTLSPAAAGTELRPPSTTVRLPLAKPKVSVPR